MRTKLKNYLIMPIDEFLLNFRRMYYYLFKRKKMFKSIAERKGTCNYEVCGDQCCIYYGCNYYNTKTKMCKINSTKPFNCKFFPFDERDKPRRLALVCKFHWDK